MDAKRYHYEIGFPKGLPTKFGQLRLIYSEHAKNAAVSDRYAQSIQLPQTLNTDDALAIEVEVDFRTKSIKVLYRISYDSKHDLCLVVIPDRQFVKTVWLNEKRDPHRTLRRELYSAPEARAA